LETASPYFASLFAGNLDLLLGQLGLALDFLVVVELVHALLVLGASLLHLDGLADLRVADASLALESQRSYESLDLGGLLGLSGLSADHELSDVVRLGQVEELSDLVGSLGSQSSRLDLVGQTGDILSSLLNDNEVHNRQIGSNDAPADSLSLAGTLSSGSEALHVLVEQQSNTSVSQDTLHHREALLVVASTNTNDVAGEFLAQRVGRNFSCDS
jgi:hypothetical protein